MEAPECTRVRHKAARLARHGPRPWWARILYREVRSGRSCGASEAISGPGGLHVRLVCPVGASRAPATPRGPRRAQGDRPAGAPLPLVLPTPKVERTARAGDAYPPTRRPSAMAPSGCAPPCLPRRSARRGRPCPLLACSTASHGAAGLPTHCQRRGTSCSRNASAARVPFERLCDPVRPRVPRARRARRGPRRPRASRCSLGCAAPLSAAAERVRVDACRRAASAPAALPGTLDGLGHHSPPRATRAARCRRVLRECAGLSRHTCATSRCSPPPTRGPRAPDTRPPSTCASWTLLRHWRLGAGAIAAGCRHLGHRLRDGPCASGANCRRAMPPAPRSAATNPLTGPSPRPMCMCLSPPCTDLSRRALAHQPRASRRARGRARRRAARAGQGLRLVVARERGHAHRRRVRRRARAAAPGARGLRRARRRGLRRAQQPRAAHRLDARGGARAQGAARRARERGRGLCGRRAAAAARAVPQKQHEQPRRHALHALGAGAGLHRHGLASADLVHARGRDGPLPHCRRERAAHGLPGRLGPPARLARRPARRGQRRAAAARQGRHGLRRQGRRRRAAQTSPPSPRRPRRRRGAGADEPTEAPHEPEAPAERRTRPPRSRGAGRARARDDRRVRRARARAARRAPRGPARAAAARGERAAAARPRRGRSCWPSASSAGSRAASGARGRAGGGSGAAHEALERAGGGGRGACARAPGSGSRAPRAPGRRPWKPPAGLAGFAAFWRAKTPEGARAIFFFLPGATPRKKKSDRPLGTFSLKNLANLAKGARARWSPKCAPRRPSTAPSLTSLAHAPHAPLARTPLFTPPRRPG